MKMRSTMRWWIVSEEGKVINIKWVNFTLNLMTSFEVEEHNGLLNCFCGKYSTMRKIMYFSPAFVYFQWKMRSNMGWWVVMDEGYVINIKWVNFSLILTTSFKFEEHHGLVSCFCGKYSTSRKIRYFLPSFITICGWQEHHGLVSCFC